jgi:hypothetical protein
MLGGSALMEPRTFVPPFGALAAALTSVWISPQASAGEPYGVRNEVDGWANIEIIPNERVTIVPKTASSTRPDGSPQDYLSVGFGITEAALEPLPLSGEYISSLMVMARPSRLAAATPPPTMTVPRAVTPKANPKPAAQEPQERLSWLRLSWWRR